MDNPTEIARYKNRIQADMAASLLRDFGLVCRIWADDPGGIGPGQAFVQGVRIFINSSDVEKVNQILNRECI